MAINATAKSQDVFTREQIATDVLPKLEKGKYQLDVDANGQAKISQIKNRWIQREDLE
jgi:hypothetical protein